MNKVRVLTYLVIGLVTLNIVVLGSLFLKAKKGHRAHPPKAEKLLDFDQSQSDVFKGLIDAHRAASRDLQKQLSALNGSYYLNTGSTDRDSIYQLIERKNREIYNLNLTHFDEVKSLCRPDQLEKFPLFIERITKARKKGSRRKG